MQLQARRAIAVTAAAWLILAGVLALRHEAIVAHAVDAHGALVHGVHAIGHHHGRADHLHAREGGDHDECALASALRHHGASRAPIAAISAPTSHAIDAPPARPIVVASALFRLAPKTSPPRA